MFIVGKERIPSRSLKWSFKCTVNLCHFEYLSLLHFSPIEKAGDIDKGAILSKPKFSKNRMQTKYRKSLANISPTPQNQTKQD